MDLNKIFVFFFVLLFFASFASAGNLEEFKIRSAKIFVEVKGSFSIPPQGVVLEYSEVDDGSAEAQKNLLGYSVILDYIELENATDFELEGMFAHELAHIEHYEPKNFFSMFIYGIKYQLSPSFRKDVENEADIRAIDAGYGLQLRDYRQYRLNTASAKDKKMLERYYLSPEEIDSLVERKG